MKQKQLITAISKWVGIGVLNIQMAQAGGLITVDTVSDQPQQGLTTLREAIELANGSPGTRIEFDESLFSEPQSIVLEQGELTLSSSTTIEGPGSNLLTIDGENNSRVLTIDDGTSNNASTVTISGLTFTNGNGTSATVNNRGGCIASLEDFTLTDSVVTGCQSNVDGGGIWSRYGTLTLSNTTISNNTASFKGGGVYTREVPAHISHSTITGNTINGRGAGVFFDKGGVIENSTITANVANDGRTAGIHIAENQASTLVIANSTIYNNSGVGVFAGSSNQVLMSNSIIAGHPQGDCDFTNLGSGINQNNLDTDGSCDVSANNHITVADAMLEPLNYYGGPTPTHRPQPGSPVIDTGDELLCVGIDQRGQIRPQDGDGDDNALCDIGAVELAEFEDVVFINGFDR